jgi:glycerol-3-phosphate O-acyltransferase 3/4
MGVVLRHCVLFPIRLTLLLSSHLIFCIIFFTVKALMPTSPLKLQVEQRLIRFLCGAYVASWTGVVKFHGPKPMPEGGHVWVANHTSMIDYVVLCSYTAFAVIMQLHPGWVGMLQTKVLDSLGCLWFNRTQVRGPQLLTFERNN